MSRHVYKHSCNRVNVSICVTPPGRNSRHRRVSACLKRAWAFMLPQVQACLSGMLANVYAQVSAMLDDTPTVKRNRFAYTHAYP